MNTGILAAGVIRQTPETSSGFVVKLLLRQDEDPQNLAKHSDPVVESMRQRFAIPETEKPTVSLEHYQNRGLPPLEGSSFTGAFALNLFQYCVKNAYPPMRGYKPSPLCSLFGMVPLERVAVCAIFKGGCLEWPGEVQEKLNRLSQDAKCRLCVVPPLSPEMKDQVFPLPVLHCATLEEAVDKVAIHFAECAFAG